MPIVEVPFEVEQNYAGWRLDRFLQQKIPRLSRAKIQRLIRERLRCPTRSLKPSSAVTPGLSFVLLKDVDDEPEAPAAHDIGVIHDDEFLIVLNKPSGIAVHPSARYYRHTVTRWLADHALGKDGRRADLAHRLDRETSGVLVCGRGTDSTRRLKAAFAQRNTEKVYWALVHGRVEADRGVIDAPLRLIERIKVFVETHPEGMPSVTEFRVLRRGIIDDGTPVSLVECFPRTGRQHQIRVHMESIGHPLVGDKIYGGDRARFFRFCDNQATDEDRAWLRMDRHALHAARLTIPHPGTGKLQTFEAPLAADLAAFVAHRVTWDDAASPPSSGAPRDDASHTSLVA